MKKRLGMAYFLLNNLDAMWDSFALEERFRIRPVLARRIVKDCRRDERHLLNKQKYFFKKTSTDCSHIHLRLYGQSRIELCLWPAYLHAVGSGKGSSGLDSAALLH